MRVPGIKSIACALAENMPADWEMKAVAGGAPDITGIPFTAIAFIGSPVCEVEESDENNGLQHHTTLSFIVEQHISYHRHVWLVGLPNGANYLIGSKDSVPAFKCKDMTAAPGADNRAEVTIELDSFVAWVNIGGLVPQSTDNGIIIFDTWREITEEEVHNIIDGLEL